MTDKSVDTAVDDELPTGRRLTLILAALMAGLFLAALDQTVVATALPTIAGDLHRADLLSWVVTSYLLTSTATAPLYGKIGDLYGRKKIFQIAIVIFLGASVLCALATSMFELIIFRGLQGAGAGGILTLTFAIIGDVVPLRERGRYQAYFGAVFLAASVVGPLMGGFAVDQLSWHYVFWINLPFGAVALAITQKNLHLHVRRTEHHIDWMGAFLIMAGVSALLIAGQSGGKDIAWASPKMYALVSLGVLLLVGFGVWESRAKEPLLPLELFRLRAFSVANSMAFVAGAAMFGALVFLPQYLQIVRGIKATESGLRTLPLLVGVIVTSTLAGRYTARTGRYRLFPIIGSAIIVVGIAMLSGVGQHSSLWVLSAGMLVFGAGIGLVMQTLILASQNAVPQAQIGVATSTATFFRSMGGSIGASGLGAVLTAQFASNVHSHAGGAALVTKGKANILSSPDQVKLLPPAVHDIVTSSYATALHTTFLCAIPVAAIAFVISFALPEQTLRGGAAKPVVEELSEPAGAF